MANHTSGAERRNKRMSKIFDKAHELEKQRLEDGEMPNPSLTSPEEARKYGWEIKGRKVWKIEKKSETKLYTLIIVAILLFGISILGLDEVVNSTSATN